MSIGTEFRKKSADSLPHQRLSKPAFPALLRKLARRWLAPRPRKPIADLVQPSR